MSHNETHRNRNRAWPWMIAGCLALAIAAGYAPWTGIATAEVRNETPREAFKSGGERSEIVLREMSETLRRIDGRLERMEALLREAAKSKDVVAAPPQDS